MKGYNQVYVILCNGKISQEAYSSFEQAEEFILNRSYNPKAIANWWYEDERGTQYNIYVVNVNLKTTKIMEFEGGRKVSFYEGKKLKKVVVKIPESVTGIEMELNDCVLENVSDGHMRVCGRNKTMNVWYEDIISVEEYYNANV